SQRNGAHLEQTRRQRLSLIAATRVLRVQHRHRHLPAVAPGGGVLSAYHSSRRKPQACCRWGRLSSCLCESGISFLTSKTVKIALMPWKLLGSYKTFIFGWLGGYAAFLGPVAGIMICDYFVVRGRTLLVDDLYLRDGAYEYSHGFNWMALAALAAGAGTALVGLVVPLLRTLYDYSWFVGFFVSFMAYYALMKFQKEPCVPVVEEA